MKKLSTALLMLLMSASYALPVGNPSEATLVCPEVPCGTYFSGKCFSCDFLSLGVGFYGDYVFNRHLQTIHHKDIDTVRLFTNAAYLVANFYERVDIFTTLGASRLSLNTSFGAFAAVDPHPLFELETSTAFSYSVGARATLFEYRCFSLGMVGQYFATSPNIKRLYIAAGAASYPGDTLRSRYSEWQVAAGLSYRYNDFFIPYFAVRNAHSYWKLANGENIIIEENDNAFLYNLETQKNWGYAIGLTLLPPTCEALLVTVEARFPDEKAFYVNAQIRF